MWLESPLRHLKLCGRSHWRTDTTRREPAGVFANSNKQNRIRSVLSAGNQIFRCSHPAVAASVLKLPSDGEDGGEGGDWNVEHQLPQVPQAKQVEVAEEDSCPQGEGLVFLQSRVEQVQVALWTRSTAWDEFHLTGFQLWLGWGLLLPDRCSRQMPQKTPPHSKYLHNRPVNGKNYQVYLNYS